MGDKKEFPSHHIQIKSVVAEFRKKFPEITNQELIALQAITSSLLTKMNNIVKRISVSASAGQQLVPSEKKEGLLQNPVIASSDVLSVSAVAVVVPPKEVIPVQMTVEKPVIAQPALSVVNPAPKKLPKLSLHDQLRKIFAPQKIEVRSVHDYTRTDNELDRLATQLGKDFNYLREPLRIMNDSYKFNGEGQFYLAKYVPDKKAQECVMSFFNYAEKMLLIKYSFRNTPKGPFIKFTIHENKLFRKFLTGDWFERYVYTTVVNKCQILRPNSLIARNVEITFPDGKFAELDMVIHFQGNLYVLETKTRRYIDAVMKFKNYAGKFKIPNDHIFFVMRQREGDTHKGLEAFHEIRFLIVNELVPELNRQFAPNPQLAQG